MVRAPRENRVPIMMSDEELASIDDWRFANRVNTRSDAIRRLCRMGLAFDTVADRMLDIVTHDDDMLEQAFGVLNHALDTLPAELRGPILIAMQAIGSFTANDAKSRSELFSMIGALPALRDHGAFEAVILNFEDQRTELGTLREELLQRVDRLEAQITESTDKILDGGKSK